MLRVVQHPDQKGHQLILNSLSGEVQVFGFVDCGWRVGGLLVTLECLRKERFLGKSEKRAVENSD